MRWWLIGVVLILVAVAIGAVLSQASFPTVAAVHSYLQDSGNLSLYFCPREDCETQFVQFLDTAQHSLHCALYEIDLPSVQQKLLAKTQVIEVQVVTDDDYLQEFNHSFVKADSFGLMHNKFCIIDGEKVSTGSMNPTDNDAHKNNNNLLLISSKALAANYEDEFQEMWNGQFKKGNLVLNPQIRLGNINVENYFCPEDHCADEVKKELQQAKHSIDFMTFSFTHDGIGHILLLKSLENVTIRGVMEAKGMTKDSQYQVLHYQLGEMVVKDANPRNMHHKVFIIDNETVVTGSFNPTAGGNQRNDENILIIHEREIARRFADEFNRLYLLGRDLQDNLQ